MDASLSEARRSLPLIPTTYLRRSAVGVSAWVSQVLPLYVLPAPDHEQLG
jgi:hypothetical protein